MIGASALFYGIAGIALAAANYELSRRLFSHFSFGGSDRSGSLFGMRG